MKVESWPIKRVKPYPNNPRVNAGAVDAVAASIREFGFLQPIVVDEDDVVLVGHTRLKAAVKLKLKTVPVHVAKGLSEAKRKAYRLADNKVGELATWDEALLAAELSDLGDFDLTELGFKGLEALVPPVAFPGYDETLPTEHRCPKCNYTWSGGKGGADGSQR